MGTKLRESDRDKVRIKTRNLDPTQPRVKQFLWIFLNNLLVGAKGQ
jgi:hypothetical protein